MKKRVREKETLEQLDLEVQKLECGYGGFAVDDSDNLEMVGRREDLQWPGRCPQQLFLPAPKENLAK